MSLTWLRSFGVLGCISVKIQCPYCEYEFYTNGKDKDCMSSKDQKVDKPAISTRELDLLEEIGILKDENIALKKENKQLKDSLNRINEALKLIDNRFDV